MDPYTARTTIAGIRAAVGIGAVLAPRLTARALGIDMGASSAAPYFVRLFGARELYMASPFLMPAPGIDEQELAARAVPVDAADAAAALLAGLRGYLPWRAALPSALAAVGGVYLGSLAAKEA